MGKSGLSVSQGDGAPGAGSTIRIRGGASLNASNDPLIVIDGIPVSNDAAPGTPNALATINPNDIETFHCFERCFGDSHLRFTRFEWSYYHPN